MNILRHRLLALFLLLSTTVSLQAQIPDEVTFLLRKCAEAMGHPDGVEYEMTIKAKYTVITVMKGQINAFAKDKRNKFFLTMRMTHFRVGVPDDIFSFDPNQYPDAVIMERVESPTDP